MPAYLSEEWIQEADAALRASELRTLDGERFAVQQEVGEVVYHLVFDADGARARSGTATNPDVVFRQSRSTAMAIARGQLSAQEAVLNGKITFDGNPMALLSHRRLLDRAEDVFADVRARTVWD